MPTYGHIGNGNCMPPSEHPETPRRSPGRSVADDITRMPIRWEAPSPRAWRRVQPRANKAEEHGEALDVMLELKRALDPKAHDPGKVFPESRDT